MTFQLAGAVAIVVGLIGTWLAGHRAAGWLVCVLSIGICLRNFRAQAGRPFGPSSGGRYSP